MGGQKKNIGQTQRARNEIMGFTVCHKPSSGSDLMQNCDLPPPSKYFMGPDIFSMNRVNYNLGGKGEEQEQDSKQCDDERDNKMELLKALQASQTRAREAEKKAALMRKERDALSVALLEEAMHLFAYRQHVRLLELQVLHLQQSLWLPQQPEGQEQSSKGDHHQETTSVAWVLAMVLGVTTALAWRYYL